MSRRFFEGGTVSDVPDTYGGLDFWFEGQPLFESEPGTITLELGLAIETDTAFSLTPVKMLSVGLAEEADTAFAMAAAHAVSLGLAQESDTAFELRPARIIVLGLAQETDLAFDITPVLIASFDPPIPLQRWLIRTALFDQLGHVAVDDARVTVKRGIGSNTVNPKVRLRVNRDNRGFGKWIERSLGLAGDRFNTINFGPLGEAHVFQFEISCDDDCDVEAQSLEVIARRIGH